jgi:hypothetical protein
MTLQLSAAAAKLHLLARSASPEWLLERLHPAAPSARRLQGARVRATMLRQRAAASGAERGPVVLDFDAKLSPSCACSRPRRVAELDSPSTRASPPPSHPPPPHPAASRLDSESSSENVATASYSLALSPSGSFTPAGGRAARRGARAAADAALDAVDAVEAAVESAAVSLLQGAMRLVTLDRKAAPSPPPRPAAPRAPRAAPAPAAPASPLFGLVEAGGFLDRGLSAITGVGRIVEGLAKTLDDAVGSALDEWGGSPAVAAAPAAAARRPQRAAPRQRAVTAARAAAAPAAAYYDAWGEFGATPASSPERAAAPAAATTRDAAGWRRRAAALERELRALRGGAAESLRRGADPLAAAQVTEQVEALLREKARLAQECDRLARENAGLQGLLAHLAPGGEASPAWWAEGGEADALGDASDGDVWTPAKAPEAPGSDEEEGDASDDDVGGGGGAEAAAADEAV